MTQLTAALEALHLTVSRIEPDTLTHVVKHEQGRAWFSQAYLCLYVDVPLFSDQQKKKNWIDEQLSLVQSVLRIPIYFVLFDARHRRKTGREGQDPISASLYLATAATTLFERAQIFEYHHVIYPYEGGVSLVQRMVFEKIQQGNRSQLLGDCTPLWYADVISHIASTLCEASPTGGIFSGKRSIPMYTLEEHLRQRSHLPSIQTEALQFPFIFDSATAIGDTSIETMVEQLALATPKPFVPTQQDVQIQTPVLVAKKVVPKTHTPKQKKKSFILSVLLTLFGLVVFLYVVTTVYFFISLVQLRSRLQSMIQDPTHASIQAEDVRTLQRRLALLHTISKSIPIPYSSVGIGLHGTEVTNSIENIQELLSGVDHSLSASQTMVALLQGREADTVEANARISAQLEEGYKELSQVQARLSQQDLGIDLLLGVDGFSRELLTRVSGLRESITQQKAVSSVMSGLLDTEKNTTIALVRADSSTARPLFGIPQEVVVLSVEKGKITSVKGYGIEELDALLKGKVDPPVEMKLYTNATQWRLADGAWSVDGTTSARQIAWFLSKQLHVDIDSLVMIDQTQVKQATLAIDSRQPSSLVSQDAQEVDVLGAETQGDDLEQLVEKISKTATSDFGPFLQTLSQAVLQSKITVYVREAAGAKTIHALAWDGGILTPPCPPSFAIDRDCVVGSFYLAEYDILKADGDLFSQKMDQIHRIHISSERIRHTDEVFYTAPKSGVQQKLLKYILDRDAQVSEVSVNGVLIDISPDMIGQEFEKTTISVPVELIPDTKTHVKLGYTTPTIPNEKSTYAFFVQKQPGKQQEAFSLEVSYEKDYFPKIIAPQATIGRASVAFSTTLDTNKLFALGF